MVLAVKEEEKLAWEKKSRKGKEKWKWRRVSGEDVWEKCCEREKCERTNTRGIVRLIMAIR